MMALTMYDVNVNGGATHVTDTGSQDSWILYGKFKDIQHFDTYFHLGLWHGDKRVTYELQNEVTG